MSVSLLVYVPTFADMARPETLQSLDGLYFSHGTFDLEIADGEKLFTERDKGDNLFLQQSRAWEMTISGGYDALVFIEHDMQVPPNALDVLWLADKPVVYAPYMFRHGSYGLSTLSMIGDWNIGSSIRDNELIRAMREGYYPVSGTGWGCTLIRRHVVEQISLRRSSKKNPFTDIAFSEDCLRAGIEMCGAFQIPCLHYDPDEDLWLDPTKHAKGITVKVLALTTINLGIGDNVYRLVEGEEIDLPQKAALHHAKVGDVRLLEEPKKVAEVKVETKTVAGKTPRKRSTRSRSQSKAE